MLRSIQSSIVMAAALLLAVAAGAHTALADGCANCADKGCSSCQSGGGCRACQNGVCQNGACQNGACRGGACRSGPLAAANGARNCPNCRPFVYGRPDLFYNFYVPPTCGGVGSTMYVAPGPVPPHVGYTYYTYQPLMPHEMLYQHSRTYHRYYDGGRGLTRASVKYYRSPFSFLAP